MARQSIPRSRKLICSLGKPLGNERGVALLLSLVALSMLYFIAMEVSYDSTVDYVVARQQVDRIKAYYAAKSGAELSLLRVMLYKQAIAGLGSSLGAQVSMLDPIWNFPFMWPPTLAMAKTENISEIDKGALKESSKESLMQAQYTTSISPEGGKIDINDLGSPNKTFAKAMMIQVLQIFKSKMEQDEKFRRKYASFQFEKMVNNIADYVDEDTESRNGGDESAPYGPLNTATVKLPPNRGFRTLDELHMVADLEDELFDILAQRVTVFGSKGVNVNYATHDVLMSLDPTMNEQAVNKVIERRGNPKIGGPFKDDKDFLGFLSQYNVNTKTLTDTKFPFLYDQEFNFRIHSTGLSSNVKREITAVTYDFPNMAQRLAKMMTDQEQQGQQGQQQQQQQGQQGQQQQGQQGQQTDKPKIQSAKGRPTVVYWEEN